MKSIALKLGLPEDADEAAILAKLESLLAKGTEMANRLAEAEADAFVAKHARRLKTDEQKGKLRGAFLKNREVAEELAGLLPEAEADGDDKARKPFTNRDTAKAPDGSSRKREYKNRLEEFEDMPEGESKDRFQREHASELLDLQRKKKD
jgi:hypothetical protein